MSHPPELSPEARATLDAYRHSSPGDIRRERNLAQLEARLAEDSVPASPPRIPWRVATVTLAAAAVAAAAVLALSQLDRRESRADETVVPPQASSVDLTPAAGGHADVRTQRSGSGATAAEHVTAPAPAPAPAPPAVSRPSAPRSDLPEETRLLREVRSALHRADLGSAAAILREHQRRFPQGALREDRDAYLVIVRCRRGSSFAAHKRAFERAYPQSPHLARIIGACLPKKK